MTCAEQRKQDRMSNNSWQQAKSSSSSASNYTLCAGDCLAGDSTFSWW